MMEALKGKDTPHYRNLEYERDISEALHAKFDEWKRAYNSYADQFAAEIVLKLRKGQINSWVSKLPFAERSAALKYLSFREEGLADLGVVEIPTDLWVTSSVNWEESSLTDGKQAFIWIHLLNRDNNAEDKNQINH